MNTKLSLSFHSQPNKNRKMQDAALCLVKYVFQTFKAAENQGLYYDSQKRNFDHRNLWH